MIRKLKKTLAWMVIGLFVSALYYGMYQGKGFEGVLVFIESILVACIVTSAIVYLIYNKS